MCNLPGETRIVRKPTLSGGIWKHHADHTKGQDWTQDATSWITVLLLIVCLCIFSLFLHPTMSKPLHFHRHSVSSPCWHLEIMWHSLSPIYLIDANYLISLPHLTDPGPQTLLQQILILTGLSLWTSPQQHLWLCKPLLTDWISPHPAPSIYSSLHIPPLQITVRLRNRPEPAAGFSLRVRFKYADAVSNLWYNTCWNKTLT